MRKFLRSSFLLIRKFQFLGSHHVSSLSRGFDRRAAEIGQEFRCKAGVRAEDPKATFSLLVEAIGLSRSYFKEQPLASAWCQCPYRELAWEFGIGTPLASSEFALKEQSLESRLRVVRGESEDVRQPDGQSCTIIRMPSH